MKDIVRMGLVLMLICVVAAGSLSYVNGITSVIIADREVREKIEQMRRLFPEVSETEDRTVDGMTATVGVDGDGNLVGVLAEARTEGYGGTIRFTLAVDAAGTIVGVNILSQSETPGLGDKILAPSFLNQFAGKTRGDPIALGQDIDNISGATVSVRAMVTGVNKALQDVLGRFVDN
jgi:electron transport complex protein RnfG